MKVITQNMEVGESVNNYVNQSGFAEIFALSKKKSLQKYEKNQIIFSENTTADGIYFILKGSVKIEQSNSNGSSQVLRYSSAGRYLGLNAVICQSNYPFTATARENTEVLFISKNEFLTQINTNPAIANQITADLCNQIALSEFEVEITETTSPEKKLADTLMILYNNNPGKNKKIIPATSAHLSSLTGISSKDLNYLLKTFAEKKYIEQKQGAIILSDIEKINKISKSKKSLK